MSLEKRRVPDFVQLVWTAHGLERNVWKNFPMCVLTFTSTCYKNNLMVNNKIISFHPWLFYVSPSFLCHMTLFSWNPTIKLSVLLTCNWDGTMFVWYGKEVFFFLLNLSSLQMNMKGKIYYSLTTSLIFVDLYVGKYAIA